MSRRLLIIGLLIYSVIVLCGPSPVNAQAPHSPSHVPELSLGSWDKVFAKQYNARRPGSDLNAQAFARFVVALSGQRVTEPARSALVKMANEPRDGFGLSGLDGMRWLIAVATLAVENQVERVNRLERENRTLKERQEALEKKIAVIEARLKITK